jgi:hypothetical protein
MAPRMRSRTRDVVERRVSLAPVLLALFAWRIVVTVVEVAASRISWWSLLVTAAIGVEAWRAWSVARAVRAKTGGSLAAERPTGPPVNAWDRVLRPIERVGPPVLVAGTVVYTAAIVVFAVAGGDHDVLLAVTAVVRELLTFGFLGLLLAAYRSTPKDVPAP